MTKIKVEEIVQYIPLMLQKDIRLQVHSFIESKDSYYEHIKERCPRCQCISILQQSGFIHIDTSNEID